MSIAENFSPKTSVYQKFITKLKTISYIDNLRSKTI